jgi:2-phosphosulfolactate phosphatase
MARHIQTHFLPSSLQPGQLSGATAVAIDVLRASSTINTALRNGAERVVACQTVEEARDAAAKFARKAVLLGGERGGIRIEGFDCGNSPAEYSANAVREKTVVFTTTNGTRALSSCIDAAATVVAAFVNLTDTARYLQLRQGDVHLVCAGTDGDVTGEDVLFAGGLVWALSRLRGPDTADAEPWCMADSSRIALSHWEQQVMMHLDGFVEGDTASEGLRDLISQAINRTLLRTHGGMNLVELGYAQDITLCSQLDSVPVVSAYDHGSRTIRLT